MITQIVLAAGLSSRMKSSKPLLDFGGQPLLTLILDECRRSQADEILVVLGHKREEILKQIDFSGVRVVENNEYKKGQTVSFQCALRAMDSRTRAFLNVPVDHPLITHEDINAVIEGFQETGASIVVPRFDQQEGRPALFELSLRKEILDLGPQEPANSILHRHRSEIRFVSVNNPHIARDMDTPEEYRECLRLYQERLDAV